MADYTQSSGTGPLEFPRGSIADGATFEYEDTGIVYTWDNTLETWTGSLEGGGGKPFEPTPDDITIEPPPLGGDGSAGDPWILRPIEVAPAGHYGITIERITITGDGTSGGGKEGDVLIWINNTGGGDQRFNQPLGALNASNQWSGHLDYNDIPDTTVDQTYNGQLQIGTAYFKWNVTQAVYDTKKPIVGGVVLSERSDLGSARFDGQTFDSNILMADNGVPDADMSIKATLEATIIDKLETSAIQSQTTVTGSWTGTITGFSKAPFGASDIAYGNGLYVMSSWQSSTAIAGKCYMAWTADPTTNNWTEGTTSLSPSEKKTFNTNALTFGNNTFVAVNDSSDSEKFIYSTDGKFWQGAGNPAGDVIFRDVKFGNNKFVAAGGIDSVNVSGQWKNNGYRTVYHSSDGITWNVSTMDNSAAVYVEQLATDGNGLWVGVSRFGLDLSGNYNNWEYNKNSRIIYSTDNGATWQASNSEEGTWATVAYGGGKFVAIAKFTSSGSDYPVKLATSNDGINWTTHDPGVLSDAPLDRSIRQTSYGLGMFISVYNNNTSGYTYSYDGITWEKASYPVIVNHAYWGAKALNNQWWLSRHNSSNGSNAFIYSGTGLSTDGVKLTFADSQDLDLFQGGDQVNQSDSAASGKVAYTDSAAFTMNVNDSTGTWANGQTVIGPPKPLFTSEITGVTTETEGYTDIATPPIGPIKAVWQRVKPGAVNNWVATSTFVSRDDMKQTAGAVYSTDDGLTWTASTGITNGDWKGLAYGGGTWIAVQGPQSYNANTVARSTDGGATWVSSQGLPSNTWKTVATNGSGTWVAAGQTNLVAYSTDDGLTWSTVTPPGFNSNGVRFSAYSNGVWVIAYNAYNNGVQQNFYYSTNAVDWTFITNVESDSTFYGLAANSEAFVLCSKQEEGYFTRSTDGINWTRIPAPPTKPIEDGLAASETAFYLGTIGGTLNLVSFDNGLSWTTTANPFGSGISPKGAGINDTFVAIQSNTGDNFVKRSGSAGGDTNTLTFANNDKLSLFKGGDPVRQDDNAANGTAQSIDVASSTMTVFGGSGTWSANTGNFVIGPNRASTIKTTMYPVLDSSLNVTDLTTVDPGFTSTGKKASATTIESIKFPNILPSLGSPDSTLLPGSSIFTTVKASNTGGEDEKSSNVVTPASTCTAGPIETDLVNDVDTVNGTFTTIPGTNNDNMAVAYHDGLYVIGARASGISGGEGWWSDDGTNFNVMNSSQGLKDGGYYHDVLYSERLGLWLMSDYSASQVYTSTTGKDSWVAHSVNVSDGSTKSNTPYRMAEGNGMILASEATDTYNRISRSYDGENWEQYRMVIHGLNDYFKDVCFDGEKFVFVGKQGNIVSTTDGTNFTHHTTVPKATPQSAITFGNGIYVISGDAVGSGGTSFQTFRSTNLVDWEAIPDAGGSGTNTSRLRFTGGKFVQLYNNSNNPLLRVSSDGKTWDFIVNDASGSRPTDVTYGKFGWVLSGTSAFGITVSPTLGYDQTTLTFDSDLNLNEFYPGAPVTQSATSGSVMLVNPTVPSMEVSVSSGTFTTGFPVYGPNRVCPPITFDASDPADVATFNGIKASFEGYDATKAANREALRASLIADGYGLNQIEVMGLVDEDRGPLAIDGYYPLYTSETLSNLNGDGTSHTHTFDGVTYYMPNGVTYYHGNYTGS